MRILKLKVLLLLPALLPILQLHARSKRTDTLQKEVLNQLWALPAYNFPYGAQVLTKNFPRQWRNVAPGDTAAFRFQASAYIDTLSLFAYRDLADPRRLAIPAKNIPANSLFPLQSLNKPGLKPVADTVSLMILKLWENAGTALYSAMAQQDIPCPSCEYPPRQLINMLFTVSGNHIIGKLLVTYIKGDDLERKERYCYIDEQGNILLKDFSSDEANGHFFRKEKWQVTPEGAFKKQL